MNIDLRPLIAYLIGWIIVILMYLMLFSCSPQWRHDRITKRHPEVHTRDSITIRDTIRFKEVKHDSSFFYKQSDTVRIEKGNLEIKYFYSHDTVHIDGRCKEVQTIIERKVPIYVPTTDYVAMFKRWFWWIVGIVALLISIRLVFKLYFKI